MNQPAAQVSVIICAYTEERWQDLLEAVASMRQQTVLPQQIIVVIDHNPVLLDRARQALPDVVVTENVEPRGLSGARNSGIALATGEIIAFMDEDATAAPDWLAQLCAGYTDAKVLGVGGAIEPKWLGGRPAWFPEEFDWVVGCTYRGMPESTSQVRNLIGCNMSFRHEVFATLRYRSGIGRIGTLPVGCEETELCISSRQRWPDTRFIYEPNARVHHRVPVTRGRWKYFRSRCYAEGLSKALVSRLVGAGDGLASERSYVMRTLPLGVWRGVADVFRQRSLSGLGRSTAIVSGLALTTWGYVVGSVNQWRARRKSAQTGNVLQEGQGLP